MAAPNKSKGPQTVRKMNGQTVTPVLYNGRALGHGKYLAGEVSGTLVLDTEGRPLSFKQIGELVRS